MFGSEIVSIAVTLCRIGTCAGTAARSPRYSLQKRRNGSAAKRLLFSERQRRRLAAKAKPIGRKGLFKIRTLVTPDTRLRWYRTLIAKKYDGTITRLTRPVKRADSG